MFVVESNALSIAKSTQCITMNMYFRTELIPNRGGVTPELMKNFVDAYFRGELNEAHNSGNVPSSKWVPGT